jgi:hypothetical protein
MNYKRKKGHIWNSYETMRLFDSPEKTKQVVADIIWVYTLEIIDLKGLGRLLCSTSKK